MTSTQTRASDLDLIGLLCRMLADTPDLLGAACRGRSELFDQPEPTERPGAAADRQRAAQAVCATCPAREPCAAWVASKPDDRPSGVLAGELHVWRHWRPREPGPADRDDTAVSADHGQP